MMKNIDIPIQFRTITVLDNDTIAKEIQPMGNMYGFILCQKGNISISTVLMK